MSDDGLQNLLILSYLLSLIAKYSIFRVSRVFHALLTKFVNEAPGTLETEPVLKPITQFPKYLVAWALIGGGSSLRPVITEY